MRTSTPQKINLADYQPSAFLIEEANLTFILAPETTSVITHLQLHRNPRSQEQSAPLVLDGEGLELIEIQLNGAALAAADYTLDDETLTIAQLPDAAFDLRIKTRCNPAANTALSGLYRTSETYCTQCEAQGFRRITYFLDRPDVLTRYRVRIEAEKTTNPILLSNGNQVAGGALDRPGWHFAEWHDPHPKPTYLFALVAGDLAFVEDRFTTKSGRDVVLRIYVEHGKQDRCDWAMTSLKAAMKWDEEAYGREYDLDIFMIVAVSDFNMGAMENKGLNVFNDKYILALPDTATDADYANIEAIIAHEYFHNWTGNRITCRDWFQLCLKEGLTVFRDQEFSADLRSRPVKRISDVKLLRMHQFPEDAGPLAHPVRPDSYLEINNFYTATVYEKGAELVRMMKTIIGDDRFRAAMDLYFARHDGDAATVEDFLACMADASGQDLTQFFRWYEAAGTPQVVAQSSYDAKHDTFELVVSQTVPHPPHQPPHHIPLRLGLVDPEAGDLPLQLNGQVLDPPVLHLRQQRQVFRFEGIGNRPVLSINRDFSAPVQLNTNASREDLLVLIAKDSDPFNRWQAVQTYSTDLIATAIKNTGYDFTAELTALAAALKALLADQTLEPAFRAQALTLPGETDLASHLANDVDPSLIHQTRNHVRRALGTELNPLLVQLWQTLLAPEPYQPDARSMGLRALRHQVLGLLACAEPNDGAEQAYGLFQNATNMSDRAGALQVLSSLDHSHRTTALAEFYQQFKKDHLVIDKWLSFHAQWPFAGVIDHIGTLMQHDAFKLAQPNKVRSLIGAFATLNPVCFNDPSGRGYRLVCDVILKLDAINPQVAARLAASFKSWRALEPSRQRLVEEVLGTILNAKELSKDTFEIVSRSLGRQE